MSNGVWVVRNPVYGRAGVVSSMLIFDKLDDALASYYQSAESDWRRKIILYFEFGQPGRRLSKQEIKDASTLSQIIGKTDHEGE